MLDFVPLVLLIVLFSPLLYFTDFARMTEKAIGKLIKASDTAASSDHLQHVILMLSDDGQVVVTGSANITQALRYTETFTDIKKIMVENKQVQGDDVRSSQIIEYPLLPCPPYSAGWKDTGMIRQILTRMLARIGYGDGGRTKKLGVGDPPPGWPENISWCNFRGASRSGLSMQNVTDIIVSMLQAVQVDPYEHVKDTDAVQDVPKVPPVGQEVIVEDLDVDIDNNGPEIVRVVMDENYHNSIGKTLDPSKFSDTVMTLSAFESVEQVKDRGVGVASVVRSEVNMAQCDRGVQMEYDHTYFKF